MGATGGDVCGGWGCVRDALYAALSALSARAPLQLPDTDTDGCFVPRAVYTYDGQVTTRIRTDKQPVDGEHMKR